MGKKVSIIIPVFNDVKVVNAIESIPQNDEIEVIVIDGGSDKDTLDAISNKLEKIDYYISEKDQGIYDAVNKGIAVSKSDWIMMLAADDKLINNPIEIVNRYGLSDIDIICGSLVEEVSNGLYTILKSEKDLSLLELYCSLRNPASLFRRQSYVKYGMFDTTYKSAGDRELFLRWYKKGAKIKVIDDIITLFSYGGMSTRNPFKYAFREDVEISDKYRVSRIKSRLFYIKRSIEYYGSKLKDMFGLEHKVKRFNGECINQMINAVKIDNENHLKNSRVHDK